VSEGASALVGTNLEIKILVDCFRIRFALIASGAWLLECFHFNQGNRGLFRVGKQYAKP